MARLGLYELLPHRTGEEGGTPAEFKANLKRKVKCIRNADTYDRVVIAATRQRLKAITGATSTHGSTTSTRTGSPGPRPPQHRGQPQAPPQDDKLEFAAECQTCGKLVDNDPGYYTVAKLKSGKPQRRRMPGDAWRLVALRAHRDAIRPRVVALHCFWKLRKRLPLIGLIESHS
jgi:hypothetical protein